MTVNVGVGGAGSTNGTRRIVRVMRPVERARPAATSPRASGPVCGVSPGDTPAGWSIWIVDGVTYRAGNVTCSNGAVRQRAFCMDNCPTGAATAAGARPSAAIDVVFDQPSAADALDLLTRMTPHLRLSPDIEKVRTSNISGYLVGLPIYVAIDPHDWTPRTATARSGPFSATVTAAPVALDVTVDDDNFQCDGPGEVVDGSNWRTTTSECRHTFTTRGTASVRVQIIYEHTYTSNYTPTEPFPVGETSTSAPFAVTIPIVEVQPIITDVS